MPATSGATASASPAVRRVQRGKVGWIKRAEAKGFPVWPWLRHWACRLIPWPLLRPTWTDGGPATLRREADRLRRLRAAQLPVPTVLASSPDCLVTADGGRPLSETVRNAREPGAGLTIALLAAQALCRIHRAGFCHGRPFFKDIVFDGARVTFVDFEEDPAEVMPLVTAQARDVLLFLASAAGTFPESYQGRALRTLWRAYCQARPPAGLLRVLRRNYWLLKLLALPLQPLPRRWLGRDLTQALATFGLSPETPGVAPQDSCLPRTPP